MTAKEISDINKLIAEFLGAKVTEAYRTKNSIEYSVKGEVVPILRKLNSFVGGFEESAGLSNIPFQSDWNLLMYVIKKIEELDDKDLYYQVEIYSSNCLIYIEKSLDPAFIIINSDSETKIEAVYTAIYQFIEYRNKIVKKNGDTNKNTSESN